MKKRHTPSAAEMRQQLTARKADQREIIAFTGTNGRNYTIKPGRYSHIEVVQMVDDLLNQQLGMFLEHFEDMGKALPKIVEIELLLQDVDNTAALNRNEGLRRAFSDETIGVLMGRFSEIAAIAQRLNAPIDFLQTRVQERVEAIRKLLNEDDDTAILEIARRKSEPGANFTELAAQWRDSIREVNPSGRHPDRVVTLIVNTAQHYTAPNTKNGRIDWVEVKKQSITYLQKSTDKDAPAAVTALRAIEDTEDLRNMLKNRNRVKKS